MRKTPLEREWEKQLRAEARYARQKQKEKRNPYAFLESRVPEKLGDALQAAFVKGFHLVFSKGEPLIQRTLAEERHTEAYQINKFRIGLHPSRKNLRAVSRKAASTGCANLLLSGLEGAGLGALGIGLPDIPLFLAALLRNLRQIALDYGFSGDSAAERLFALRLIEGALCPASRFWELDQLLNLRPLPDPDEEKELEAEILSAAGSLSEELLYAKFVQGIPIAGILGGMWNVSCMQRITAFARLKYNRRFLERLKAPRSSGSESP